MPPVKKAILLGIGWGHLKHPRDETLEYETEIETPGQPSPGRYNSGIMAVVPAWMIAELLDDPKVVAVREEHEETAGTEEAELDVDKDEYQRFTELTRKVVNVPKSEIDEKRMAEES